MEEAAISYQAPSIIAAGASAQSVSILATFVNLCLSLICVKAPVLIEKTGLAKRGAVTLAFSNMLVWVPLIIAFFLSHLGITPVWLAILWLLNIIPGMLLSFQRDNWLSNLVPHRTLGRYLGQRLAIKSGFYLAAFFSLGYLLDSFGEKNLASFGFVFILALVMSLADFLIFTRMHEPVKNDMNIAEEKLPKIKFGVFDFTKELKEKKLDKFILFTSFINISIGLSGPFYAVYMLQEQNFTYVNFTLIISVEFLARVVSGPFWGRYADKAGSIKVLTIVSRIVPALPICWLFSTNIAYLAFIQILSGICWGAFDLSTQSYLYKVAPQPKKLRYIVYTRSIVLFSVAVGGILGAWLVNGVFLTFGSKLLSVFMISGFFRAAVVIFLMPKLVDMALSHGKPPASTINLKLAKNAAVSRCGLFYQRPELASIPAQSHVIDGKGLSVPENIRRKHRRYLEMEERLAKAQAARKELMELTQAVRGGGRRNRAVYETKAQEKKEAVRPAGITPSRRPWYGNAEIMAAYKSRTSIASAVKKNIRNTGLREGLFHNNAGWMRYMRETMQDIIKESHEYKQAANQKPVFLESRRPAVRVAKRIQTPLPVMRELRLQRQPVAVSV